MSWDNEHRDDSLLHHCYNEWLSNYLRSQTWSLLSVPLDARIVSLCGDHWTCTFNNSAEQSITAHSVTQLHTFCTNSSLTVVTSRPQLYKLYKEGSDVAKPIAVQSNKVHNTAYFKRWSIFASENIRAINVTTFLRNTTSWSFYNLSK